MYFRYTKNIVYLLPLLFIYVIHEHIVLKNHKIQLHRTKHESHFTVI